MRITLKPACQLSHLVVLFIAMLTVVEPAKFTLAADPSESDYYKITKFETPAGEVLEAAGFQLMPDGRMAVCTRRGDIWMIDKPFDETVPATAFHRYAHGLHEPLSLALKDGWLYVTQRPEISRLKDTDGDLIADEYESVAPKRLGRVRRLSRVCFFIQIRS